MKINENEKNENDIFSGFRRRLRILFIYLLVELNREGY